MVPVTDRRFRLGLLRTAAEKLKTEGIPKQSFGNIYRCILVWGLLVRDVDFDRHRLQDPCELLRWKFLFVVLTIICSA